jgi:hypothetical protein
MSFDEICSILVSMSVLKVDHSKILDDAIKQLTPNLHKLNNNNLIQLLSAGKYIFKYKKHSGIFYLIIFI